MATNHNLKVSLVQAKTDPEKQVTLKKIESYVLKAKRENSDLVVFPELFMFYSPVEESNEIRSVKSESLNGEYLSKIKKLAKKYHIGIIVGIYEKVNGKSKIYNTIVVINKEGELELTYRKTHLYDAFNFKESDIYLSSDNDFTIFKLGNFKIGIMVCYEIRFPEIARTLVLKGADAIIVPSAWVRGYNKEDQWLTLVKARAIENTVYILTANQIGNVFTGITCAADPMGNIIMRASEEEGLISIELRKERINEVRKIVPVLRQRQPVLYKL